MQSPSMDSLEQERIFRSWFPTHLGLVLKVVRGCTPTPQDQDDLLQDVLLQIWSSIPAFRNESRETTWIYRVAFNTALAWRRSERRRREGHELFLKLDTAAQVHPSHTQTLQEEETVNRLYAAIRKLPKVDTSLALMLLDGLSYQEMSEVVGISENYVGVKLNRIRKHLAEELKGYSDEI